MTYILILVGCVFVNNVVLSQFMGICAFLGVSKQVRSSAGMGGAVIFVMVCATAITYPLYKLLEHFEMTYLKTVAFILVIAMFVQLVEIVMKKKMHALYKALGVYLPLITTNCAVLGVTLGNINNDYTDIIAKKSGYILAKKIGMKVRGLSAKTKLYFFPNAFLREFIGLLWDQRKKHLIFLRS